MPVGKKSRRPFDVKAFAIAVLRRASYRSPTRSFVLKEARVARNSYRCKACGGLFVRRDVAVDHIEPVVRTTGWVGFDDFIQRLFCPIGGLQVLCKPCHKEKTQKENAERRQHKKAA